MIVAPPYTITVPGRLCLAGEHSDWAADYRTQNPSLPAGSALVVGLTSEYLRADATPSGPACTLTMTSASHGTLQLSSTASARSAMRDAGNVWRFAAAAAYTMQTRFEAPAEGPGLSVKLVAETLPARKGLSSSAAVCVLVVRAYGVVFDLGLSALGEMHLAYEAERLTGSACGRMDQVVAAGPGAVSLMYFEPGFVDLVPVPVAQPIFLVASDLGRDKDTRAILTALQRAYPKGAGALGATLRAFLGRGSATLVARMRDALTAGDAPALGALMDDYQKEFDAAAAPLCEAQLTAPVLHTVLTDPEVRNLVHGGKGVGSQGDGAVQFVAKGRTSAEDLVHVLHRKLGTLATIIIPGHAASEHTTTNPPTGTGDGRSIDTAVVPAAGFGTRLFPASAAVRPKALLPIVDADGFAKPVLLHVLEQVAAAGVQRLIVVCAPGSQERAVRGALTAPEPALRDRLKPLMREYADRMAALARRVSVRVQRTPEGFGHAVSCAFPDTDSKHRNQWSPFTLMLGDVVFTAANPSPVQQVLTEFERGAGRVCVVGVSRMPRAAARAYGVVRTAAPLRTPGSAEDVVALVEKPSDADLDKLCDGSDDHAHVVLGPYALTGAVMAALKKNVQLDIRDGGEIQLTSALIEVMGSQGLRAVRLSAEALDTGNAAEYVRTFAKMGAPVVQSQ